MTKATRWKCSLQQSPSIDNNELSIIDNCNAGALSFTDYRVGIKEMRSLHDIQSAQNANVMSGTDSGLDSSGLIRC